MANDHKSFQDSDLYMIIKNELNNKPLSNGVLPD